MINTVIAIPVHTGEYPFKYAGTRIFQMVSIVIRKEKMARNPFFPATATSKTAKAVYSDDLVHAARQL